MVLGGQVDFSVLMCVYGGDRGGPFIDAYESVLAQSRLPNEVVLVIDGPIPKAILQGVKDFQSRLAHLEIEFVLVSLSSNVGHGRARAKGIQKCTRKYVAIVDADDINHKDRFIRQVDFLAQNPQVHIVGSQVREVDEETRKEICIKRVPCAHSEIISFMKYRCPFNQMSVMFSRERVLSAGNYLDFYHNEDYYLWIRMYLKGAVFANLEDVLVDARVNLGFYLRRGGIRYFASEARLQWTLYRTGMIPLHLLLAGVFFRFILQVLAPPRVRGAIFRKFFRD